VESKLIAMIVGVVLVLATAATTYTQSALAAATAGAAGASGGRGGTGTGNGVTGQHTPPITSCSGSTALHNPNCNGGTPGGGLRVKPVEGW